MTIREQNQIVLDLINKHPEGLTSKEILDIIVITHEFFDKLMNRIKDKVRIIRFGNAMLYKPLTFVPRSPYPET